jgi:hypothetical protein
MRHVVASLLTCVAITPAFAASRREVTASFPLQGAAEVVFEMEVGELTIETADIEQVDVALDIRCRTSSVTCERRMEQVEAVESRRDDRLQVAVSGIGKTTSHRMEVDARVRVPRRVELVVDMGIGELDISGVDRDLYVDMGIGEVRLRLDAAAVGSVYLDAGIGESALYGPSDAEARSSRPFLVGSELAWEEGAGGSEVVVDLGIGEIAVHLD